jgi:hypothetical protein
MALICNDPSAADATLAALKGYNDPVGQSRLIALRRRHPDPGDTVAAGGEFRGSTPWQQAVAALDQAQARPGLTLS